MICHHSKTIDLNGITQSGATTGQVASWNGTAWVPVTLGAGSGDALVASNLDQFAGVTQTAGQTLAITASTTLAGGVHSGTNTGDQTNITGNAATVTTNANLTGPITSVGNATTIADAELAAIAGLTSAADKGIQFTGAGTAATFDLTTAGKALLDDATAADQRATLSIGAYTQSDTAPISPANGDKWLHTTTGIEYVRYDSQWISDAPASNLATLAYRAITALRTLDSSDYTVDCTANSFAVTLPTAVGSAGRVYNIKNTGNGLITVATTSSQTIDGAASGTITLAQYACLTVQSTGANWIIL